jgi:hypothetical protein
MRHPADESLRAMALAAGSPVAAAPAVDQAASAAAAHVAACAACQVRVRDLATLYARLSAAVAEPPPERVWSGISARLRNGGAAAPAAGGAILGITSGTWGRRRIVAAALVVLAAGLAWEWADSPSIDLESALPSGQALVDPGAPLTPRRAAPGARIGNATASTSPTLPAALAGTTDGVADSRLHSVPGRRVISVTRQADLLLLDSVLERVGTLEGATADPAPWQQTREQLLRARERIANPEAAQVAI